jgi:hypothetical protein
MYDSMMKYVAAPPAPIAEIARQEFAREYQAIAVPTDDPQWRQKTERFVLANTPERHKYGTADGGQGIVYFDARDRAASALIGAIPDEDLARIAAGFSRRAPGEPDPDKPHTSSADHGYRPPVRESSSSGGDTALQLTRVAGHDLSSMGPPFDDRASLQAEGKRVDPALAFPGEDKQTKKGSFKVSSKALAILKKETGITSPADALMRSVRKIIDLIPHQELPKMVGEKSLPDAQDQIANHTRTAFHRWLSKLKTYSPKAYKRLQSSPDDAALMFYVYMRRVVSDELAGILFKRYFQSAAGHPGELKRKDIGRELDKAPVLAGAREG